LNSKPPLDNKVVEALFAYEQTALVGKLLKGVVHNLAGALQLVRLPLDLLEFRLQQTDNPDVTKHLASLQEGIARVTEEVELLAAKSTQGMDSEPRPLDLSQFAREQLSFWRADMFFKHELELETDLPLSPARVRASYADLSLAFNQIIFNSIEAMKEGPSASMRVELVEDASQAGLRISDSGPGPDAEIAERMFEPFTGNKGNHHLGLGLFLARTALLNWGGNIIWETEPRNSFAMMLPRTA
jgi:signal transduction histidine kinase